MALPIRTRINGRITQIQQNIFASAAVSVDALNDITCADAEIGDTVAVSHGDEEFVGFVNAYVSARGVITVQVVAPHVNGADFDRDISLTVYHRN